MVFTSNKCPNCGAPLPIKENQRSIWCEYCGSQILVEGEKKWEQPQGQKESTQRQKEKEPQFWSEREEKAKQPDSSQKAQEKRAESSPESEIPKEELEKFQWKRKTMFIVPLLILALYLLSNNNTSGFFCFLIICVLIALTREKKDTLAKQYEAYQRSHSRQAGGGTYTAGGRWKNKWVAFFLCLFLGFWGFHKFYEGKIFMGILYLLTGGLLGIGWFIDLILLLIKPNPYLVS